MNKITTIILLILSMAAAAKAETVILQDITTPTVFHYAQSPYKIMKNIEISSVLTIEKGVVVLLDKTVSVSISGRINAQGTVDSIIKFVAISTMQHEHWGKLIFLDNPSKDPSILKYCVFQNGGFSGTTPIEFRSAFFPECSHISLNNNKKNAIDVHTDVIRFGAHLKSFGVPYTFSDNCYIEQDRDLIIDAGVVLKLPGSWFIRVRGNIWAHGTPEEPIIFTSFFDDEADGIDSDNLGGLAAHEGDWGGMILEGSVNHTKTSFRNCKFRYGGGSMVTKQSYLYFYNSMASIDYCTFELSAGHAASTFSDALPDFGGGQLNSHGHNKFFGFYSPRYAISNQTSYTVYAKFNCWGTSDTNFIAKMCQSLPGSVITEEWLEDCEPSTPTKPRLINPDNYTTSIDTVAKFDWSASAFADYYRLQISKMFDFSSIDYDSSMDEDTSAIIKRLKPNTLYHWRAAAVNLFGQSEWSDAWTFRTLDDELPEAPVFSFPINDWTFTFCDVNLKWNEVPSSIANYYLQVSENTDFTKIIYSDSTMKDTAMSISGLDAGKNYFWRVSAKNNIGWGDFSPSQRFFTRSAYITEPVNLTNEKVIKAFSADVNGDGFFDIVAETAGGVFLYKNQGINGFAGNAIADIKSIKQLEFADFNKDNKLDFAILGGDAAGETIFKILRFDGSGVVPIFELPQSEIASIACFAVGDLYGSGSKDLAFTYSNNDTLSIFKNTNGSFAKSLDFPIGGESGTATNIVITKDIIIKDLDNNGTQNIVYQVNFARSLEAAPDTTRYYSVEISGNAPVEKEFGIYLAQNHLNYNLNDADFSDPDGDGFYDVINFSYARGFNFASTGLNGINFVNQTSLSPTPKTKYRDAYTQPLYGKFIDIDYDGGNDFLVQDGSNLKIIDTKYHTIASEQPTFAKIENFKYQCLFSEYDVTNLLGIRNDSLFAVRNKNCALTQPKPAPIELWQNISGDDVIFEWEISKENYLAAKNDQTGGGLNGTRSFNLKVGTYAGGNDVLMPESDPSTGRLFSLKEGNAGFAWHYLLKNLAPGKYYWSVQTIDGGFRYSDFSQEKTFEIKTPAQSVPPEFTTEKPVSGISARISVKDDAPLTFNGAAISEGSVVAVYLRQDTVLTLESYSVIKNNEPFRLTVWNDGVKDLNNLNNYVYKLWDKSQNKIINVTPRYDIFDPSDMYFSTRHLNLLGIVDASVQTIDLKENKWQYVSGWINPADTEFDGIFQGKTLILFDESGSKYQSQGTKEISNWGATSAYKMYSFTNTSFDLIGTEILPSSLNEAMPEGLHYLPYPYKSDMPVDSVFAGFPVKVIVNSAGEIFFSEQSINTIGNVSAGEGVKVFVQKSGGTLNFRDNINFPPVIKSNPIPEHYTPIATQTGSIMHLIVDCPQAQEGDEIAAINAVGITIGAAKFDSTRAVLAIWGDNLMTETIIDGAADDEILYFSYYKSSNGKKYLFNLDSGVVLISPDDVKMLGDVVFKPDYILSRELNLANVSVEELPVIEKMRIYPNPAQDMFILDNFEKEIGNDFTILNTLGEVVKRGKINGKVYVQDLPAGVYIFRTQKGNLQFIKI